MELFERVDDYLSAALPGTDPGQAALAAEAGLPPHAVAPNQGKLLHLPARVRGARRVLELGPLGGYSTIWLAAALPPDGRLVSLERDEHHARVARGNLAAAGFGAVVEVHTGAASELLPALVGESFDLVFIDADKAGNPDYFAWAVRLTEPGAVIVVDNVVRGGAVLDAGSADASVRGTRALFDAVAAEPRVSATAVQTVGGKGHDGFLLALRVS